MQPEMAGHSTTQAPSSSRLIVTTSFMSPAILVSVDGFPLGGHSFFLAGHAQSPRRPFSIFQQPARLGSEIVELPSLPAWPTGRESIEDYWSLFALKHIARLTESLPGSRVACSDIPSRGVLKPRIRREVQPPFRMTHTTTAI